MQDQASFQQQNQIIFLHQITSQMVRKPQIKISNTSNRKIINFQDAIYKLKNITNSIQKRKSRWNNYKYQILSHMRTMRDSEYQPIRAMEIQPIFFNNRSGNELKLQNSFQQSKNVKIYFPQIPQDGNSQTNNKQTFNLIYKDKQVFNQKFLQINQKKQKLQLIHPNVTNSEKIQTEQSFLQSYQNIFNNISKLKEGDFQKLISRQQSIQNIKQFESTINKDFVKRIKQERQNMIERQNRKKVKTNSSQQSV